MFNHNQLVAFVGILAVHDIYTNVRLIRTLKLFRKSIDDNLENRECREQQIKYLCYLLEKYDVPINEFDMIALNNPIP